MLAGPKPTRYKFRERTQINIAISPEIKEKLNQLAIQQETTITWLILNALDKTYFAN